MLPIFLIATAVGGAGLVTVSGETITSAAADNTGLRVNTDGTIDKQANGGYTQIDSATDWIIPNTSANADYEVFLTVVSGDAPDPGSDSVDTWLAMTSNREWATNTPNATGTWRLSIRYNGGSTLDTGDYAISTGPEV